MKEFVCEICGEKDLIKDDGVFVCQSCGTKYTAKEVKAIRKGKKGVLIAVLLAVLVLCAALAYVTVTMLLPASNYKKAEALLAEKDFEAAIAAFAELGDYEDAEDRVLAAKYQYADHLMDEEQYEAAIEIYEDLDDYKRSEKKLLEAEYVLAERLMEQEDYEAAAKAFEELEDYEDAAARAEEAAYENAKMLFVHSEYSSAKEIFTELEDYGDSDDYLLYIAGMEAYEAEDYAASYDAFSAVSSEEPELAQAEQYRDESLSKSPISQFAHLEGVYYQHSNFGDPYTLTVSFELRDGVVHPILDYTNYMGDLQDDGTIVATTEKAGYAYRIEVSGDWQKGHHFTIYFDEAGTEALVSWASSSYNCYKEG